ncbi:MAG: D-alanyl-D-alanine carboxypeptidase [Lachnospiraceae bacterium]|nr:D-alanyl-D-alanine carboxypeptidase [Lachnospiraceae bacterium]
MEFNTENTQYDDDRRRERMARIAMMKRRKKRQDLIRHIIMICIPLVLVLIVFFIILDAVFGIGISSYRAKKKEQELAAAQEYDRQMESIRALPIAAGIDAVTFTDMTTDPNASFLAEGEEGSSYLAGFGSASEAVSGVGDEDQSTLLGGGGIVDGSTSPFMDGYASSSEAFAAHTDDTTGGFSGEVISEYGVLMDDETGTVVAQRNGNTRISPASMTKVLTVLVAAENLPDPDLEKKVPITIEVTDFAYRNDCSAVGFSRDEQVTIRDLFYGTILPSGGDAAYALSCYVAGSMDEFADLMNEKLKSLGIADSAHFTNSVGLYDEDHYCTIYDMAIIMDAAMRNEFVREVLSAHTYTTSSTPEHPEGITISNWFLRRIEDKDCGGFVVGAKTGFVVQSRNCAVSYATGPDGHPYICATGASTSGWKCIYDHVRIYKSWFDGLKFDAGTMPDGSDQTGEEGEAEEGAD